MQILVACPTLGVTSEVWILRQIDLFAEQGHDLSVVCWRQHGYNPQDFTDKPVDVLPHELPLIAGFRRWADRAKNLRTRNFVRGWAQEERELGELLERRKPDVVLCQFGHVALRVLPVARRLGIPVVAHFHGADLSKKLQDRWYRWTLESQAIWFEQAVVVGSHQARLMSSFGLSEDRLNLIPCGVPTDQFQPQPRPAREHTRFILVSRIVPWKGIEQSIRAFAHVYEQRAQSRLVVIGDGAQLEEMQQLASELGLQDVIDFAGPLGPARVVQEFQASDIFLQHSLTSHGLCEGFGVSIAEASAMALPVVVTRCGGIVDQVLDGQTGYLVEERDVQAMQRAMLKLVDDPALRQRMGAAGRQRMIDHFDTQGQVDKLEYVLRKAAGASMSATEEKFQNSSQPVGVD